MVWKQSPDRCKTCQQVCVWVGDSQSFEEHDCIKDIRVLYRVAWCWNFYSLTVFFSVIAVSPDAYFFPHSSPGSGVNLLGPTVGVRYLLHLHMQMSKKYRPWFLTKHCFRSVSNLWNTRKETNNKNLIRNVVITCYAPLDRHVTEMPSCIFMLILIFEFL